MKTYNHLRFSRLDSEKRKTKESQKIREAKWYLCKTNYIEITKTKRRSPKTYFLKTELSAQGKGFE